MLGPTKIHTSRLISLSASYILFLLAKVSIPFHVIVNSRMSFLKKRWLASDFLALFSLPNVVMSI